MPNSTDVDRCRFLLEDFQNLGMTGQRLVVRMDVELAEAPTERRVLLWRHVLVPEEDDEVVQQRLVDLGEGIVVQGPGKIDAANLGAQGTGNRGYFDATDRHIPLP